MTPAVPFSIHVALLSIWFTNLYLDLTECITESVGGSHNGLHLVALECGPPRRKCGNPRSLPPRQMRTRKSFPYSPSSNMSAAISMTFVGLCLFGSCTTALATLGEILPEATPTPAASSSPKLAAQAAPVRHGLYSVHETRLETGTIIKELTDSTGRVFAITWKGPVLPDFQALLGSHFDTLRTETKKARAPGRLGAPLNIEQQKVVIRSSGRMRHFSGHAFAPDLVPAGVNINDALQ